MFYQLPLLCSIGDRQRVIRDTVSVCRVVSMDMDAFVRRNTSNFLVKVYIFIEDHDTISFMGTKIRTSEFEIRVVWSVGW